jgi:hypothetical protein
MVSPVFARMVRARTVKPRFPAHGNLLRRKIAAVAFCWQGCFIFFIHRPDCVKSLIMTQDQTIIRRRRLQALPSAAV